MGETIEREVLPMRTRGGVPLPVGSWRSLGGIAAVAVLAVALLVACLEPASVSLPPEVLGTWVTAEPVYAGRYLELRPDTVIFGTGEVEPVRGQITFIGHQYVSGTSRYDIDYMTSDGAELQVVIYYLPVERTVELKSRPGVRWKKQLPLGGTGS